MLFIEEDDEPASTIVFAKSSQPAPPATPPPPVTPVAVPPVVAPPAAEARARRPQAATGRRPERGAQAGEPGQPATGDERSRARGEARGEARAKKPAVEEKPAAREPEKPQLPTDPPPKGEGLRSDQWLYLLDGAQRGPIDVEDLIDLVLTSIPENTKVWHPGLEGWVLANQVRQIADEIPPPIPVPGVSRGVYGDEEMPDFNTVPPMLRSVLIADEDAAFRKYLAMPLAAQGFTIFEAADGSAAWQLAVQNRPWMILADISMPELDGFEFCRRVRNHPMLSRLPLLFISGSDKYKERYRALQIGADDFLSKNMPVRELLMRIQLLMTRYSDLAASEPKAGTEEVAGAFQGRIEVFGAPALLQMCAQGRLTRAVHLARRGLPEHRHGHGPPRRRHHLRDGRRHVAGRTPSTPSWRGPRAASSSRRATRATASRSPRASSTCCSRAAACSTRRTRAARRTARPSPEDRSAFGPGVVATPRADEGYRSVQSVGPHGPALQAQVSVHGFAPKLVHGVPGPARRSSRRTWPPLPPVSARRSTPRPAAGSPRRGRHAVRRRGGSCPPAVSGLAGEARRLEQARRGELLEGEPHDLLVRARQTSQLGSGPGPVGVAKDEGGGPVQAVGAVLLLVVDQELVRQAHGSATRCDASEASSRPPVVPTVRPTTAAIRSCDSTSCSRRRATSGGFAALALHDRGTAHGALERLERGRGPQPRGHRVSQHLDHGLARRERLAAATRPRARGWRAPPGRSGAARWRCVRPGPRRSAG